MFLSLDIYKTITEFSQQIELNSFGIKEAIL